MLSETLEPEIRELIEKKDFATLKGVLSELELADVADLAGGLEGEQLGVVFRLLPRTKAAEVFGRLELDRQERLLQILSGEALAGILNNMPPDDRTELLEELPEDVARRLIGQLSRTEQKVAIDLLRYPEDSIGRLMTPQFVAVGPGWTVQQVLDHIRQVAPKRETLSMLYVVDAEGRLLGDMSLEELVLADPRELVPGIMDQHPVHLSALADREEAVRMFKKYDALALPAVDVSGVLVGIVTVDDVMDVQEEESTEDFHKMAGVEALDEPYMAVSVVKLFRKRGLWLSVLFLGEMFTASAMSFFQSEIAQAVVLVLFIPLIISSGGNSGSQAATLIIRAMATREVRLRDWWRVFSRELLCGLLLGMLLGAMGCIRVHAWQWMGWVNYTPHYHLVAFTVAAALVGVVLWGTLMGSMLPFLLRRLRLDPATISAPFIATLVDVSGLIIYFTMAILILRGTLL